LLPPVHAVLGFQLQAGTDKLWLAYDCGKEGIGLVTARETEPGVFPKQGLFKEESDHSVCVHSFPNPSHQGRPLQLYNLLDYGWAHTTPISLKWHLEKYKDDVIEAITRFCNTTCWGFVNGALELFTDYQLETDNDVIKASLT